MSNLKLNNIINFKMNKDTPLTLDFIERAINNPLRDEKCCQLHNGTTCLERSFNHFCIAAKSFTKLYFAFLFAHFLFARRKKILNQPKEELKKFAKAFTKSLLFSGGYMAIVRGVICLVTNLYANGQVSAITSATLGGSSLVFQPSERQPEISLFIFTNTLQTLFNMAKRRNMVVAVPHGTCILYVVSLAVICYHYFNNKESMRRSYLSIMDKILADS